MNQGVIQKFYYPFQYDRPEIPDVCEIFGTITCKVCLKILIIVRYAELKKVKIDGKLETVQFHCHLNKLPLFKHVKNTR